MLSWIFFALFAICMIIATFTAHMKPKNLKGFFFQYSNFLLIFIFAVLAFMSV